MRVDRIGDPSEFRERVAPLLLRDEARHNLLFGILGALIEKSEAYPEVQLFAVEEDGGPVAAALMTPPYNLIVSQPVSDAALPMLARSLHEDGVRFPGVVGGVPEVEEFVGAWEGVSGRRGRRRMAQGIYALRSVRPVARVSGEMRDAKEADRELLWAWMAAFSKEALHEDDRSQVRLTVELRLRGGCAGFAIWQDAGRPVSLVGWGGPTPSGIRIGPVYTPRERRSRGYASALVAAVSRRLLDEGYKFCFLYTDLDNPTSNRIYRAIGYELVCDSAEYAFE